MKTYTLVLLAIWTSSRLFAQGTVNFLNNPSSLVSVQNIPGGQPYLLPALGSSYLSPFYFGLFTAPAGSTSGADFTFSGVYATNTTVAGRFDGGSGVTVPGWMPGTAMSYEIVGWNGQPTWNQSWVTDPNKGSPLAFGISGIGTGVAGGNVPTGTLAPLDLFGGTTGIQGGFTLFTTFVSVPEPSSTSLICIGATALLFNYQRGRNRRLAR